MMRTYVAGPVRRWWKLGAAGGRQSKEGEWSVFVHVKRQKPGQVEKQFPEEVLTGDTRGSGRWWESIGSGRLTKSRAAWSDTEQR